MVLRRVKARYTNGVLEPEEPLGLEEGCEVEVTVEEASSLTQEERLERMRSAAGSWKGHSDPEELKRMISEGRRVGSREPPNP
jgi:predicted DNA-binding antitoxin AbrB/MazE fold protein